MFSRLIAFFRRINELTDGLRTAAFWLHLIFWAVVLLGVHFGLITVVTKTWLQDRGFIAHALADEHHAPVVGYELPAPITIILNR